MHVDLSRHPDYAHLPDRPAVGTPFTVTSAVLARLRGLNAFALPRRHRGDRPVVVALRGASLPRRADLMVQGPSVDLVVDQIDHETARCVILVWESAGLTAFQGSTVPHRTYLAEQWRAGGRRACLLPTGRYLCRIGTHNGSLADAPIPGALVLPGEQLVYRAPHADEAHRIDTLEPDWHAARTNLHAARTPLGAELGAFSSAGCVTVPGDPGQGPWVTFQARVGGRTGHRREVIVLTGAEACLAATRDDVLTPRIRPGSLPARIRAVQRHLGLPVDGVFGVETYKACVERWQVAVPALGDAG